MRLSNSIQPVTTGARAKRAAARDMRAGSAIGAKGESRLKPKRPEPARQVSLA